MQTYHTSEVARLMGVHPNTVRLYEEWRLIPPAERKPNGYRVFTDFHVEQFRLARTALRVEVLQNGLRKKAVEIIKTSARGDLDGALRLTEGYRRAICLERIHAEEAVRSTKQLLSGTRKPESVLLRRQETADRLQISIDTLRNWEMNGLLTVKRRENGYRVYTGADLERLKIIRALRCANYSLAAILRMLGALSHDPRADIRAALDTPDAEDEIIAVCDKLLTSLAHAEQNAGEMTARLRRMKEKFK